MRYIPIGNREHTILGREMNRADATDPEMQKDRDRVGALLGGSFNQTIADKLRGKELFIKFMKTPDDEINNIPKAEWEKIETILRTTSKSIQDRWIDEEGI